MSQTEEKKQSKSKWLILLLLLITLIAVCVAIWALFFRGPSVTLAPDFAPEQTEQNQQPIEGDNSETPDVSESGGAVSLTYADTAVIDLSDETASLYFANPSKSDKDMVLQIVIQDEVIVQSGRITAGHEVTLLNLLDGASEKLSAGGYNAKFIVFYYNTETGEKEVVNTEIPITVTVIN